MTMAAAAAPVTEIQLVELEFGTERLGCGGSGTVYKGKWKRMDITVAIKTLIQEIPAKELEIMGLVKHTNIVKFYGAVLQPPFNCIVIEFAEQGSLFDFMQRNEFHPVRNLQWAKEIATGMKYLHFDVPQRVVIHGDLKSKNVLITADNTVKITDFGSSKVRNQLRSRSINTSTTVYGTLRWMAPEVLDHQCISKRCDVYSFGIVLWELLTHRMPFEETNDLLIYTRVVANRERPSIPETCPPILATLLTKCWKHDPQDRPEFTDILPALDKLPQMLADASDYPDSSTSEEMNSTKDTESLVASPQRKSALVSEEGREKTTPDTEDPDEYAYVDLGDPQNKESQEVMRVLREISLTDPQPTGQSSRRVPENLLSPNPAEPFWAITRDEIELTDEKLGEGAWGFVMKARFRGQIVAAKCLHEALSQQRTEFLFRSIRREMNIAANLRHPNLVLFVGAVIDGDLAELIILNELMDCSLRDVLAQRKLSQQQIKSLSSDVSRALNYLHSWRPYPLIHRDVSSANVLLERLGPDNWKAKVSDYGSLRAINLACTVAPGNPVYAAPEAMQPGLQSCKMDTYSFGALLIEMCTGLLPAPDQRGELLQAIKWPEMLALVEDCIQENPEDRPTMHDIIHLLEELPLTPELLPNKTGTACQPKFALARQRSYDPFEAVAMFDFAGDMLDEEALSLRQGEKVTVLDNAGEWWKARDRHGNEGFIPSNHVRKATLTPETTSWYAPNLSRAEATIRLNQEGKEGSFLVRDSSRSSHKYTLSMWCKGRVHHYGIKEDENHQLYVGEAYRFPTVEGLVEFYTHIRAGLITTLRVYTPPDGELHQQQVLDSWEIPKTELVLDREVAKGERGRVVSGTWKGVNISVRIVQHASSEYVNQFIADAIKILKEFQHRNLVRLYGVCTQEKPTFIVTELLHRGTLNVYLQMHPELDQKTEVLLDMTTQICAAMKYLEARGIVHRDVATRNCLVGERNMIKVADYSLPLFTVNDHAPSPTMVRTRWAAPEVLKEGLLTIKSDIWSFGILLWELWSRARAPYPGLSIVVVKAKVLSGYHLERPMHCPEDVYDLMEDCWNADAFERPSFASLYDELTALATPDDIFGIVTGLSKTPPRPPPKVIPNLQYVSVTEIPRSELVLGKELARGGSGRLVAGSWNKTEVAIRILNEDSMHKNGMQFIEDAVHIMKQFSDENLLKLCGICVSPGEFFIVTELLPKGPLDKYLVQNHRELLKKNELLLNMAIQICSALKFLESKWIVHRDVAARNCLVGERNRVKLADSSLSVFTTDRRALASEIPLKWAAPEVIKHGNFSNKSDMWSYAVLLWELWTGGQTPYPTLHDDQAVEKVLSGYHMERPKHCPRQIYKLMLKCWDLRSERRPQFAILFQQLLTMQM